MGAAKQNQGRVAKATQVRGLRVAPTASTDRRHSRWREKAIDPATPPSQGEVKGAAAEHEAETGSTVSRG